MCGNLPVKFVLINPTFCVGSVLGSVGFWSGVCYKSALKVAVFVLQDGSVHSRHGLRGDREEADREDQAAVY